MFRIEEEVAIRRPAADVSGFLADVGNERDWQEGIVHVQLLDGQAGQKGARFERVQVVSGRNIKTVNELVEYSAGKRVAYKAAGKVIEYRLDYSLAAEGPTTRLSMRFEGEMLGFASMFEGMAADELRAAAPRDLVRLQKLLEA